LSTTDVRLRICFFNQSPVEIFSSRSAQNGSIKVQLKNKNQGTVDPELFFNRDRDRDEKISSRV